MTAYLILKYVHVLGAVVILGTGTGIAFFMLMAHRTGNPAFVAQTAAVVVIADMLFTASAVVVQPITGAALMATLSIPWNEPWLLISLALYVVAGLFWLRMGARRLRRQRDAARGRGAAVRSAREGGGIAVRGGRR